MGTMFGKAFANDLEVPVGDGLIVERGFDCVPPSHGLIIALPP